MKKLLMLLLPLMLVLGACGRIETGHVGVQTSWNGHVSPEEMQAGFYTAVFSSVKDFVVKETSFELNDLKPKAKDRLLLQDLDVSVYYTVAPASAADLYIKYSQQTIVMENTWFPAQGLVKTLANSAIQSAVSEYDSMTMHTQRDGLEAHIQSRLQSDLDTKDPGIFKVTRVVVRTLKTDAQVEQSIQNAIKAQNQLEQAGIQVDIARKQAEATIATARGTAEANRIINGTLTREYLQHETNQALHKFAESGTANTIVIPANMTQSILNIPTGGKASAQ